MKPNAFILAVLRSLRITCTKWAKQCSTDRAVPVSSADSKWNRHGVSQTQSQSQQNVEAEPKPQSYAEVASLLKGDGAHIPGILNPTQLAGWIQM
ncbi:embryo sac development arrest [Olea europaea subsp. europaea]|uniref:Embryo sac development arrest n=1 Tax=Olea europaea subsp. europaea TaxID=158383 RepID=A0A8S0SB98_OLEEU|nr:embryo sac development arrest [Olea europaea subsp. europaea]